ncbi:uncharacterized protein TNCT_130051 [Trichonephila clavata]|uniref:Uncharacterized protein n=1 Tax=Trichonephila clavata TaxID=2740835 RepID=A0A8X6KWQ7_TRICU|nr:uncharacterized protein TNCT_130051 [Trichonephila clavata]
MIEIIWTGIETILLPCCLLFSLGCSLKGIPISIVGALAFLWYLEINPKVCFRALLLPYCFLICLGFTPAAFILMLLYARILLIWRGFTPLGIRPDSYAQRWHREIGMVRSGSFFANCQSFGIKSVWNKKESFDRSSEHFFTSWCTRCDCFIALYTECTKKILTVKITVWWYLAYGVIGGIVAVVLPRLCLCCLGFTCRGIGANTCASEYHSHIGDVESGTCFSICQRTGVIGFPCCINIMFFLFGFATTIIVIHMKSVQELDSNTVTTPAWMSSISYT